MASQFGFISILPEHSCPGSVGCHHQLGAVGDTEQEATVYHPQIGSNHRHSTLAGLLIFMQSPTAREKGPGCSSGTWTKDHLSRHFITPLPPCLKQTTPGFLHRSVFCRDPSRLGSQQGSQDSAAGRGARSTHTRPLKAHHLKI